MKNNDLVLEYLLLVKQDDTFCTSAEDFLKFLDVDSRLETSVSKQTITLISTNFEGKKFSASYSLESKPVPGKKERYFKFLLKAEDKKDIGHFDELSKILEKNFLRIHKDISINILWNDIARQYALEGYAVINEVENLLRRLIANFMLINVGLDWHKSHVPEAVITRNAKARDNYSDYLHQTYFGDLKTILFDGQREKGLKNIGDIQLLVQRHLTDKKDKIDIGDIEGVIAKSLWEKYFSSDVKYTKEALVADLESLNTLRNEIAHNQHISLDILNKIKSLSKKVIGTLKLELDKLPEKILTEEEKKVVVKAENLRSEFRRGHLAPMFSEKAVMDWYAEMYGHMDVDFIFTDGYAGGTDLILSFVEKRLGVQIKQLSIRGAVALRNEIAHNHVPAFLDFANIDEFDEYHFVIVLKDYSPNMERLLKINFHELLKEQFPNLSFNIGYLDQPMAFQPSAITP